MKRRRFLQTAGMAGLSLLVPGGVSRASVRDTESKAGFTLWQLASQVNTIGNSYVLLTDNGRVVVMDGGVAEETSYLRGFLAALGNEVEAWFISHPHADHMGALREILKAPGDVRVKRIYHSRFSESLIDAEPGSSKDAREFYALLDKGEHRRWSVQRHRRRHRQHRRRQDCRKPYTSRLQTETGCLP